MSHTADDENAAELSFGKEFLDEEIHYLMNDEVLLILDKQKMRLDSEGKPSNDTFEQTLSYIRNVTPTVDTEVLRSNIQELRNILMNMELVRRQDNALDKLHKFEMASIANLIPQESTPEEVRAWIPSLSRYDEDQIQIILDKVARVKNKIM